MAFLHCVRRGIVYVAALSCLVVARPADSALQIGIWCTTPPCKRNLGVQSSLGLLTRAQQALAQHFF